jgi:hypothetical protein
MSTQTDFHAQLGSISTRLHHLLGLRTAFAPFRAALERHTDPTHEGWERRQLLSLWRPCQARLDQLLDYATPGMKWASWLDLLRQELEGNLVDERYSPAALADVAGGFEQACEAGLLQLEGELRAVVQAVERSGGGEEGGTP